VSICSSRLWHVRFFALTFLAFERISSLGLNYRLQKAESSITVVAFIIMPAATHSYTIEALKGQAVTKQLRDTVTEIQHRIGARLFDHAARFHG
jgi:Glycogen synthase